MCSPFFCCAKSFDSLNVDDHQRKFKCMNSVFADFFLSLLICYAINFHAIWVKCIPRYASDNRRRKKKEGGKEWKKWHRWWIDSCRSCISVMVCQNEWVKIERPKFDEWKEIHFSFCQLVSGSIEESMLSWLSVLCTIAQIFENCDTFQ